MSNPVIDRPARTVTRAMSARSRARRRELNGAVAVQAVSLAASRRNDLVPDMNLETRPIASLRAPKRNVRKHDPVHEAEIAGSICELGFVSPPIITADGEIIDGVTTVAAADKLALTEIPCLVVSDLAPERVRLLRIALNRLSEKGAWDLGELKIEFEELVEETLPLVVTGFMLPEIDLIMLGDGPAIDGAANECPEPDTSRPCTSCLGDEWILGRHRLLCGDATKPGSYARLFQNMEPARAVFTDPPYNIRIDGFAAAKGKHGEFVAASGEMSNDEYVTFLVDFLRYSSARLIDGGIVYCCMDWRHAEHVLRAARAAGLSLLTIVVWSKGVGGLGGLYRSAHELVFVLKKGDGPVLNNVELGKHGRDRTNVWVYPGANRRGSSANAELGNHPTPKPVELVADALLDVTHRGEVIIDPFMGSGTSVIAAQKTGRVAYGLELDPHYVDLIIKRFETFTGTPAVHAVTGKTFDEMTVLRTAEPCPSGIESPTTGHVTDLSDAPAAITGEALASFAAADPNPVTTVPTEPTLPEMGGHHV